MADPNYTVQDKLFTDEHLRVFGVDMRRAFPLPEDSEFEDLLEALDRVEPDRDKRVIS